MTRLFIQIILLISGLFGTYYQQLRSQLAQSLRKLWDSDFSAEFLTEALLT